MIPFTELTPEEREDSLQRTLSCRRFSGTLWLFAYGSLLWRPGFHPTQRLLARLEGYRRDGCVWTVKARGNPIHPGLGLGLRRTDQDHCQGLALKVPEEDRAGMLERLWQREMLTGVYQPTWVELTVSHSSATLRALAFVVNEEHPQYARDLSADEQATCIATAYGKLGSCKAYWDNTLQALHQAGFSDPYLEWLNARVNALSVLSKSLSSVS